MWFLVIICPNAQYPPRVPEKVTRTTRGSYSLKETNNISEEAVVCYSSEVSRSTLAPSSGVLKNHSSLPGVVFIPQMLNM